MEGGGVKMRTFPWGILEWGVYFPQYREHYKCEDEDGEGGRGGCNYIGINIVWVNNVAIKQQT